MTKDSEVAALYRTRAEQLRRIADGMSNAPESVKLSDIADDYERMAKALEELDEARSG